MNKAQGPKRSASRNRFLSGVPWWFVLLAGLGAISVGTALADASYRVIFSAVGKGLSVTLAVAAVSYLLATAFGLLLGLARVCRFRPLREAATFYIELVRGLPMLVILYYIAFVGAPALAGILNGLFAPLIKAGLIEAFQSRNFDFTVRAVLALTLGYAAFIAEIFRAGIESVDRGQIEAAHALGMNGLQVMFRIVLPQGIRNVLPALANEFVAMIKDSALVSVLGVQDITQLGKVYAANTFKFFETYNVVAFFYLCLTVSLSLLVRALERRIKRGGER